MQYFVGFVSPGSTEADKGGGRNLDNRLMANCVKNICIKNDYNLIILLQKCRGCSFTGHGVIIWSPYACSRPMFVQSFVQ